MKTDVWRGEEIETHATFCGLQVIIVNLFFRVKRREIYETF